MDLFGGEQRSDFVELARRFGMQLWAVHLDRRVEDCEARAKARGYHEGDKPQAQALSSHSIRCLPHHPGEWSWPLGGGAGGVSGEGARRVVRNMAREGNWEQPTAAEGFHRVVQVKSDDDAAAAVLTLAALAN
jgi:hypothetical protein